MPPCAARITQLALKKDVKAHGLILNLLGAGHLPSIKSIRRGVRF